MTGGRDLGPAQTHTHHYRALHHNLTLADARLRLLTERALNLADPASRSLVLAALRALHLDAGFGSALSTSRSEPGNTP